MTRPEPELEALLAALAAPPPEPPPELASRAFRAARAELRAGARPALLRELARLAAPAAAALPVVVAVNFAVVWLGSELLAARIPEGLGRALLAAYALGALGWLSLFVASLPALAHRALARRLREGPS